MGDEENVLPPSKKRVAGRQLTKDDPVQDDDAPNLEMGTFKKASEEVMATRRIVKVRRNQPAPAASSNPFAGIHLVASSSDTKTDISIPQEGQGEANENCAAVGNIAKGTEIAANSNDIEDTEKGEKPEKIPQPLPDTGDENSAVGNDAKGTEVAVRSDDVEGTEKNAEKQEKIPERLSDTGDDKEKKIPVAEEVQTDSESVKERTGDQEKENGNEAEETNKEAETDNLKVPAAPPAAPLSSFQQLSSSQNAFSGLVGSGFSTSSFGFGSSASGLAGTGFLTSSFGFGSLSKEGFSFGTSPGTTFSYKDDTKFSLSTGSTNGGSPSPGTAPDTSKSVKLPMQEVPLETGEENEKSVFTADAIMYEYMDGGWKERGKGELKLNVSVSEAEKARLVMRAKGNFRLILNASIYPDMSLTNMDKKGVTFACINSAGEGKAGLITVALKFKDSSIVQEFHESVSAHKGKKASSSEPSKDAD